METGQKNISYTVFICGQCREEHKTVAAAERCQASHDVKNCQHRNCAYTGAVSGRMILVTKTCLKCGMVTNRDLLFEAMDFWKFMNEADSPNVEPTANPKPATP